MSAAPSLDKEINQYLSLLTDRQKEAVLTVVKTFARKRAQATTRRLKKNWTAAMRNIKMAAN